MLSLHNYYRFQEQKIHKLSQGKLLKEQTFIEPKTIELNKP
jgi:hypothetical protein